MSDESAPPPAEVPAEPVVAAPEPAVEPVVEPVVEAPAPVVAPEPPAVVEPPAPVVSPVVPPVPDPVVPPVEPPPETPEPTLSAPTLQPAVPMTPFGQPDAPAVLEGRAGTYVDPSGVRHPVRIVAERPDGSVDILMPATVGGYRRDCVRRRLTTDQVSDYIE